MAASRARGLVSRLVNIHTTSSNLNTTRQFRRWYSKVVTQTCSTTPRKNRDFRILRSQVSKQNRQDLQLERAARLGQLSVDLGAVCHGWMSEHSAANIRVLAKHSGVFEHVFEGAEFNPDMMLNIHYNSCHVHCGNFLMPSEASHQPEVEYQSDKESLWTLLFTNPDGNMWEEDAELLHWLVANIPGNRVSSGTELCEYLPPIPPQGTGVHRYVFCLLKQKKKLDLEDYGANISRNITSRSFSTPELLGRLGEQISPRAMAFFQASWDDSVPAIYTDIVGIPEPVYKVKQFITPSQRRRESTREKFATKYRNM